MIKLVLVRHGQSVWNQENKFTGWTDVELSTNGIKEAIDSGHQLKEKGYIFDIAFTSVLKRANDTLNYILEVLNETSIPIYYTYKLNERHYGALQGLNKDEIRDKYGAEQLQKWRRSTDVRPPSLKLSDPRYPGNDPKYKDLPTDCLPTTENLLDTQKRVIEYYESTIIPYLKDNKKVIIVAHGNSLRALIKYLDKLTEEQTLNLEIATGTPIIYELDDNLNPLRHYYINEESNK